MTAPPPLISLLIQQLLDENEVLLKAICENQNVGRLAECKAYMTILQRNLFRLAKLADTQNFVERGRFPVAAPDTSGEAPVLGEKEQYDRIMTSLWMTAYAQKIAPATKDEYTPSPPPVRWSKAEADKLKQALKGSRKRKDGDWNYELLAAAVGTKTAEDVQVRLMSITNK